MIHLYLSGLPVIDATEDEPYSYTITTSDEEGDDVTITAPTLPTWLMLTDNNDGTAILTGTPRNPNVGDHPVSLVVTDDPGDSNMQNFTITVNNTNGAPVFIGSPVVDAAKDEPYTHTITTLDDDGDDVTITAPTLPEWLIFTDNGDGTAVLAGTPSNTDVRDHPVALLVTDSLGATGMQEFTITIVGDHYRMVC